MPLGPTAILSTIGAGIGGALGFAVGGPSLAVDGAKIGLGLGIQVGVVNKAEDTADKIGQKVSQGIDTAGRKVEQIADKAINGMDVAQQKLMNTIESVAHAWSTIMLSGYAMQVAMNGVNQNMVNYNTFCKSTFDNLNCVSMTLTTFSLNTLVMASCAAVGVKIYRMVTERKI